MTYIKGIDIKGQKAITISQMKTTEKALLNKVRVLKIYFQFVIIEVEDNRHHLYIKPVTLLKIQP